MFETVFFFSSSVASLWLQSVRMSFILSYYQKKFYSDTNWDMSFFCGFRKIVMGHSYAIWYYWFLGRFFTINLFLNWIIITVLCLFKELSLFWQNMQKLKFNFSIMWKTTSLFMMMGDVRDQQTLEQRAAQLRLEIVTLGILRRLLDMVSNCIFCSNGFIF